MLSPTRINLINTKKSIAIAEKGHELLKSKQQVLVREFLKLLKDSSKGRDQMQEALQSAATLGEVRALLARAPQAAAMLV